MGLLDSDNMEYFKNKLFGYPDDENYEQRVYKFGNESDSIYDNQRLIRYNNKDKSYWDMIKDGNIAGPFRQNFPLEEPAGYRNRRATKGLREEMNRYLERRWKNK